MSDLVYNSERHQKAMLCVARKLASFRLGLDADAPYDFNEHEMLMAGHIVGSMWAQGLLVGLDP